jgi:hypothetical protein
MTFRSPLGRLATTLLLFFFAASGAWAATDRRKFSTSPTLAAEANALIKLLAELHYNRGHPGLHGRSRQSAAFFPRR